MMHRWNPEPERFPSVGGAMCADENCRISILYGPSNDFIRPNRSIDSKDATRVLPLAPWIVFFCRGPHTPPYCDTMPETPPTQSTEFLTHPPHLPESYGIPVRSRTEFDRSVRGNFQNNRGFQYCDRLADTHPPHPLPILTGE
eukprot:COSAG02_NODE_60_length_43475_cov_59.494582_17_plen_143_part_00